MLPESYQKFLTEYRGLIIVFLLGLILISFGALLVKKSIDLSPTKVEVLEATTSSDKGLGIIVEVGGAVEKPGVYKLAKDSRVEDALISAGGISADADRVWIEKSLNRAARLSDGQKIYILSVNEHLGSATAKNYGTYQNTSPIFDVRGSGLVNINTATLKELDSLPGIGQTYAQNIIEHRRYSTVEELLSKGVLKKSVYEKIKDKVTVY